MILSTRFHRFVRTTATLRRKLLRKADHTRWTDAKSFCPEWSERAKIIAGLIPKGSRVIEFGAGMRQLQSYLDPSCTYIASDLISRGQDELIVDFEKRPQRPSSLDDVMHQVEDGKVYTRRESDGDPLEHLIMPRRSPLQILSLLFG